VIRESVRYRRHGDLRGVLSRADHLDIGHALTRILEQAALAEVFAQAFMVDVALKSVVSLEPDREIDWRVLARLLVFDPIGTRPGHREFETEAFDPHWVVRVIEDLEIEALAIPGPWVELGFIPTREANREVFGGTRLGLA